MDSVMDRHCSNPSHNQGLVEGISLCSCDMSSSEKLTLVSLYDFVGKTIVSTKNQNTFSVCYPPTRKIVAPFGPQVRVLESARSKARLDVKPSSAYIIFLDSDHNIHGCIARTKWRSVEQYAVCTGRLSSSFSQNMR